MRVWIFNAPNGVLTSAAKQQIAYGLTLTSSISNSVAFENYLRRYLSDPTEIETVGPRMDVAAGVEDADSEYIRRYLGDPV